MSAVLFAGPTIGAAEARARLPCTVLPPAAVGDLLRAVRGGARAILLVDGVFERAVPVWHKEILWALTQGTHVFGAASMGALRAAELAAYGMVGVGAVFADYRSRLLEADDEVAVLHGPAEAGFAAVTEALVNVRATLAAAVAAEVVVAADAAAALAAARAIHFRDRTWELLLARLDPALAGRLRAWLPAGRVDRKRLDALELLDHAGLFLAGDPPPFRPGFAFAWTDAWDALFQATGAADEAVLDELRLGGGVAAVARRALVRVLAADADRSRATIAEAEMTAARERLRVRHKLWRRADLERWLATVGLGEAGFAALCREEAAIAGLLARRRGAVAVAMLAELRASGGFAVLAERARDKQHRLAEAGLESVAAATAGIDLAPELARLAAATEAEGAENLAVSLGFADRADLERAVLRELLYRRIIPGNNGGAR